MLRPLHGKAGRRRAILRMAAAVAFAAALGLPAAAQDRSGSYGLVLPEGPRILFPVLDPARGRELFVEKGCIVCHSVNGVGGEIAPALDAAGMPDFANPFDFAARMLRGAEVMIELQKRNLGYRIELTGDELADIIGFVHDEEEQRRLSPEDVPARVLRLMPFERL